MHIISNLNDTRFTLDGAQYLKNYISRISENRITIFNCYDNKDVLLPWIVYSEVQLNGSVYPNAQALHAAILDVIYLRTTLGNGPAFNQNNKGRVVHFGNYFVPNGLPIQNFQVAAIVNALPFPIVIQADESPIFFSLIKEGKTYLFCFLGGKGTWGTNGGGTAVTSTQLTLVSIYSLTQNEIENNPGATIIALGDLPTGDYLTAANSTEHDFTDSGSLDGNGNVITYYFSYTQDEVLYFVQFVGEPGVYGGGNANFLESDLVPSTNSNIVPSQNLQQTMDIGSQYTGTNPVLMNVTDGVNSSVLELTPEAASLKHNEKGLNLSDAGAVMNTPVKYQDNYHADYGPRTFVDREYVDELITYQLLKDYKITPVLLTGTTTNTIVLSVLFPANTLENCSYLVSIIAAKNAASASSVSYRMYFGTANTIAGSTQIAFTQGETGEVQTYFSREIYIEGNNLRTVNFTAYAKNAMYNGNASSSYQVLAINKTVNNYLNFAIKLDNSADSAYYDRIRIIKIKNKT